MNLQEEIRQSLDVPGWDESIAAVKHVVAGALHRLDPEAEIKDTAYFNHSFVPDFVVTWPQNQRRARDVFLRLDSSNAFIAGDLRYLGDARPVLMGLTGLDSVEASDHLTATTGDTAAMITEPAAVEQLTVGRALAFDQVLPAAMLKGGKGLVTKQTATSLSSAGSDFFRGARSHDPPVVEQSVALFTEHLEATEFDRLTNFGRIVWEATGGDPSGFPIATPLAGVDDAGFRFLLESGPSDDTSFWRTIGRLVSLERLLSLGVRQAPNLRPFILANADRLYANTLLVKGSQPRLDDSGPTWSLESGGLAMRGLDFVVYISPRRDDLSVRADDAPALDLASFRRRTSSEQVETVTIIAGDGKRVTIESQDIFDPATDRVLASVGGLPGTAIESVGLIVGGKHLECSFVSRHASGHTSARFDVLSLLERGLPMLWPFKDRRDITEIRAIRRSISSVALPPSLFDDVEAQGSTDEDPPAPPRAVPTAEEPDDEPEELA